MTRSADEVFDNLRGLRAVASLEKYVMKHGATAQVRADATRRYVAAVDDVMDVMDELEQRGTLRDLHDFLKTIYGGKG